MNVIPNPRDKRRRTPGDSGQRTLLHALQFFNFCLALLILAEVSHAAL